MSDRQQRLPTICPDCGADSDTDGSETWFKCGTYFFNDDPNGTYENGRDCVEWSAAFARGVNRERDRAVAYLREEGPLMPGHEHAAALAEGRHVEYEERNHG